MNIFFDYFIYFLKSKSKFGVHSPFVFGFFESVFSVERSKNSQFLPIEEHRKKLLKNDEVIVVEDFGTGKQHRKNTISFIASNSLMKKKYAEMIANLSSHLKPKNILELGTSLGVTTLYLSFSNSDSKILTIEGSAEIAKIAKSSFEKFKSKNIEIVQGNFDDILESRLQKMDSVDMVIFDGNHTKSATIRYFETCLKYINNDTVLIFDDIRWSKDMKEAWKQIVQNELTVITIDLFFMGLVFFRKEQPKEHFQIRF
ncbi:MAG: class I SAM-dependent methyltransferase [Bacteroidetes bacterium]|nr:class I SAM-dependent methyltransferase [Bacteroidota bacterium]